MGIVILGVGIGAISGMAVEFDESIRISAQPTPEWTQAFSAECGALGLGGANVGIRFDLGQGGAFQDGDIHHVTVRRRMQMVDHRALSDDDGLMSAIQTVVDRVNSRTPTDPIELLGAELLPSKKFALLMDLPVEIQAGSEDEFQQWCNEIVPAIYEAGISQKVGMSIHQMAGARTRYFLVLRDVQFQYRAGRLVTTEDYVERVRELHSRM